MIHSILPQSAHKIKGKNGISQKMWGNRGVDTNRGLCYNILLVRNVRFAWERTDGIMRKIGLCAAAACLSVCLLLPGCTTPAPVGGGMPLTSERLAEVSESVFLTTVTVPYDPEHPPVLQDGEIGWTASGQVFHTHGDCRYLKKTRELTVGRLDAAGVRAPGRLCSACAKRDAEGKEIPSNETQTSGEPVPGTEPGAVGDTD